MGWWRRLFGREPFPLEPGTGGTIVPDEPEPDPEPEPEPVPVLVAVEEPVTMSTAQGDALRAQAETLINAKPALASMRDWYTYWKTTGKVAGYTTVHLDVDNAAATLRLLADVLDQQPPPTPAGYGGYGAGYGDAAPSVALAAEPTASDTTPPVPAAKKKSGKRRR